MISTVFYERRKVDGSSDSNDQRIARRRNGEKAFSAERRRLASQMRRYGRTALNISVRLQIEDKQASGYLENLSSQGLLIVSEMPLSIGAPLNLQFSFADVCYLNLSGRVVYSVSSNGRKHAEYAIGIKFSAIREWEQKILVSAIQELHLNAATQDKSLLSILVSRDTMALEAANFTIKTPFIQRVARYSRIKQLRSQGLYLWTRPLESSSAARVKVNGREMIMLASTNYLGLTTHPKVKEAARMAVEKFGVGAGGVRLLAGTHRLHEELETKLADLKRGEACIVYSSGYIANLATIASLLGKEDCVILDKKDHASIVDGCIFSKCRIKLFNHNDTTDLQRILEQRGKNSRSLIIVDSIYSMDGDLADLIGIYKLAQEYKAILMIDEAHATGVLGKTGRGAAEHFGLEGKIDIVMGSLSKGLGGVGGFIVGQSELIDYLKHNARSFIFSEAVPPLICASVLAAIEVLELEPEWINRLWSNAAFMRKGLQALGYDTGITMTPIIPVIIGDEMKTHRIAKRLETMGIFVSPIAWPAVDRKASRLRVIVMATHTQKDLSEALSAFEKAGRELGII